MARRGVESKRTMCLKEAKRGENGELREKEEHL